MKRSPLLPFVLIMVLGVAGMFLMSFKGLDDMKDIAAQEEKGGSGDQQKESSSFDPESFYQSKGCVGCHGADYAGSGQIPALKGVGDRRSHDEIVDILVNGKNNMPAGLATKEEAEKMADWLVKLK